MTGQCKLCLEVCSLQKSHFLPKGIFKRLRDEKSKNPYPFTLSKTKAFQTSKQKNAPLLCSVCERRFSENGENWVLGNCLQGDGSFPLASFLSSRKPAIISSSTKAYYAAKIPEINIFALAYFAASIFWRGAVYPWNRDKTRPIELGKYFEPFRKYLLGRELFPTNCYLTVVVRETKEVNQVTYEPVTRKTGGFHIHRFPIPGLAFGMSIGQKIPDEYRKACIVNGPGNPILVTTVVDKLLEEFAVKRIREIYHRRNLTCERTKLS
jgi:hypothetical protein